MSKNPLSGSPTTDSLSYNEAAIAVNRNSIINHIADIGNPHAVTKTQLGLNSVDNTSDVGKPVSTAQATAIGVVQTDVTTHKANMSNPHAVTKSQVGLGNVDNTSDASKPVSTATQNALDLKANITQLPKYYKETVLKTGQKLVERSSSTSGGSGVVSFDLTDGSGNAVFTSLGIAGCTFFTNSQVSYNFSSWTLSGDKKTLTVVVSYPSISIGVQIYLTAGNGLPVYLKANGE